jgi:SAM-dependent methyltransferase
MGRLAIRYGGKLRQRKWELYVAAFPPRPGERILDVGASIHDDQPNENYFLRRYPYPDQVVAVTLDKPGLLRRAYPGVTFVQADGRALPFVDDEFDVVHSNAVIEHVTREDQPRFARELVRVARAGMITSPNRLFPFDPHTRLPFIHWLPRPLMLAAYRAFRRPEEHVWPLTISRFRGMFPHELELRVECQRIAGVPATTTMMFRKAPSRARLSSRPTRRQRSHLPTRA